MNYTDPNELLPVVDENDCQVGVATRREIHQKGLLHRAVHVLLFDSAGRLYLQRRSKQKDTHPLKWTSSASGHVDPDEGYGESAQRELQEELGLKLDLTRLGGLTASERTENEFMEVYTTFSDQKPNPNPDEILEGRYFTTQDALALAADPEQACPSLGAVLELWQGKATGG